VLEKQIERTQVLVRIVDVRIAHANLLSVLILFLCLKEKVVDLFLTFWKALEGSEYTCPVAVGTSLGTHKQRILLSITETSTLITM
jgi:hypothetical protein